MKNPVTCEQQITVDLHSIKISLQLISESLEEIAKCLKANQ